MALNDLHTFEAVSSALDDVASVMGSCRIYERIYSNDLESAKAVMVQLPRLYTHCLVFMAETINYFQTKTSSALIRSSNPTSVVEADIQTARVAKGVTNPFKTRFKPLINDINNGKGELERRCTVASRECMFQSHSLCLCDVTDSSSAG